MAFVPFVLVSVFFSLYVLIWLSVILQEGNKHAYFHFRQVYYRIFVDTTAVIYANISLVLSVHFCVCVCNTVVCFSFWKFAIYLPLVETHKYVGNTSRMAFIYFFALVKRRKKNNRIDYSKIKCGHKNKETRVLVMIAK